MNLVDIAVLNRGTGMTLFPVDDIEEGLHLIIPVLLGYWYAVEAVVVLLVFFKTNRERILAFKFVDERSLVAVDLDPLAIAAAEAKA